MDVWHLNKYESYLKNYQKQPPDVFLAQVFSCEFSEIFKNTFLQKTSGWLLLNYVCVCFSCNNSFDIVHYHNRGIQSFYQLNSSNGISKKHDKNTINLINVFDFIG